MLQKFIHSYHTLCGNNDGPTTQQSNKQQISFCPSLLTRMYQSYNIVSLMHMHRIIKLYLVKQLAITQNKCDMIIVIFIFYFNLFSFWVISHSVCVPLAKNLQTATTTIVNVWIPKLKYYLKICFFFVKFSAQTEKN
jgi:hypothetical protein